MKTVSATDAKQRLAALLDAAQREPVVIRRHERDVAVLVSADQYERMRGVRENAILSSADYLARQAIER